ncbi:hypothetical protein LTR85_001502 [Meristemomyces frigidus]|nr:hypothetical protein LTR85_001502 [Meristemomyces frigidus]
MPPAADKPDTIHEHPYYSMPLMESVEAAAIPTVLPLVILEEDTGYNYKRQLDYEKEVAQIAIDTGLSPWRLFDDAGQDADLLKLTVRLTKVSQQMASLNEANHRLIRNIEVIWRMHKTYKRSQRQSDVDGALQKAMEVIDARLEGVIGMSREALPRAEKLRTVIQANIQTARRPDSYRGDAEGC